MNLTLYLVHIKCPLQVNHILHDGAAVSISLSAVKDFGVFISLQFETIY
jgi:hypothetical protein